MFCIGHIFSFVSKLFNSSYTIRSTYIFIINKKTDFFLKKIFPKKCPKRDINFKTLCPTKQEKQLALEKKKKNNRYNLYTKNKEL